MAASLALVAATFALDGCSLLYPIDRDEYQVPPGAGGNPSTVGGEGGAPAGATGGSPLVTGGTTPEGGAPSRPTPEPRHHYEFDQTAGEAVQDVGAARLTEGASRNGAILTPGTTSWLSDATRGNYLYLGDNTAIQFHSDLLLELPFTVALWVKPEKPEMRSVLDKQTTDVSGFRFLLGQPNGVLNVPELRVGGKTAFQSLFAESSLAVGTWVHLAFSYEKITGTLNDHRAAIYVNGRREVDTTKAFGSSIVSESVPLNVGIPAANLDIAAFMGGLDDLRIYDVALTADEVAALYLGTE